MTVLELRQVCGEIPNNQILLSTSNHLQPVIFLRDESWCKPFQRIITKHL